MLHITLRQLKIYDAVARHLSYSRAAEALHLTQPAVSMQIKQLEKNAGLALFEQFGKKIYLTDAGKEFQNYCRNILQQLNDAESMFADYKGMSGKLSICVASTASYFTPQLLARFCRRYPKAQVRLNVTNRETLLQQLAHNEVDMAVMGRTPEGMELDATPFMDNRLVIVAPPDHALASEGNITLSRLSEEVFLVREQGSGTRVAMEDFFADQGIHLNVGAEMSTNEAIKQAVQAGMGLGILSLHTVQLELEVQRLVVLDVQSFPIQRRWYVVHRQGKRLGHVAQAFKKFLLDDVQNLTCDTEEP